MPLWGSSDNAANSVKYATELTRSGPVGSGNAAKAANNTSMYANVTPGAFNPGMAVGQFAVSDREMANSSAAERAYPAHTGWQIRSLGTGPVVSVAVNVGGTGYNNTDTFKISGGTTNATGTLSTNSTGGLANVTLTNPGVGFTNTSSVTVAFANSTGGASAGSTGTLTITLGGRAGRKQYETIVAGGMTSTGNTIPANT